MSQDIFNKFSTPANQKDFPDNPLLQGELEKNWDLNLRSYTSAARVGNPWTNQYDDQRTAYFDPIGKPRQTNVVPVTWGAFPNRLKVFFGEETPNPSLRLSQEQMYELADTGHVVSKPNFQFGFPKVPTKKCPSIDWNQPVSEWETYGPAGPRGWLDEYSEFSVEKDAQGEIRKIHFTCENPEYWYSLWRVNPDRVADIYNQVLGTKIKKEDLALKDKKGKIIIDPITGLAAYNPLNPWNHGTAVRSGLGGAMHLTSPPNTIGAEIYLGGAATILRNLADSSYSPQNLICCSKYGQPFRNSDPHIGFAVNQIVKGQRVYVTLSDPIGLYIQTPDFDQIKISDGTKASSLWKVVRGRVATGSESYDQILHAVFEIPAHLTPSKDIKVAGQALKWASQIQQTFQIALGAWEMKEPPGHTPKKYPCVEDQKNPNPWPQLIIGNDVLQNISPDAPLVNVPPVFSRGKRITNLALLVVDGKEDTIIRCDDPFVNIKVNGSYIPPGGGASGQTGVFSTYAYIIDITVAPEAKTGEKGIIAINSDGAQSPVACPGLFVVN